MTSLLVKLVTLPLVLFIATYLFDQVNFGSIWQPIILAIVLAVIGVGMEYVVLKEGTLWMSVTLDFISTLLIIWLLANMFTNAEVTFFGALGLSLVIGFSELILHRYLIGTRQTTKPVTDK